ncbi:MAG TPA: hypothetical protein VMU87_19625 [Stellaceae bacterium]|nr:hypothetical protein [Stellaceae bacterium]
MPEQASSRRFEVWALRDKRWLIDSLARNEEAARARADELYADDDIEAVRVVRGRFGNDGTSYETVLTERVRTARRGERPVRIAAAPDEEAWCETLDDLYGPASRQMIARLLRNFLDRYAVTPTELLHHHRYVKQLERQAELMGQAMQRVATHQARLRGLDMRQRLDALDRLVNAAIERSREALASRAAPRLGEGGLKALGEEVTGCVPSPSDQAFYLRFAVSRAFEDQGVLGAKMELLTQWAAPDLPGQFSPLIDELAAGLLGAASLLQEMLGPQPHLAAALTTLADLAAGRAPGESVKPPTLAALARLLGRDGMGETRLVLLERVQRELASDKPLSRDDLAGQKALFNALVDKLIDERGMFAGGSAMIEAIARRSRRFEIVGGIDSLRFASAEPVARLAQLVDVASGVLGERQQRAVATAMAEIIGRYDGEPAALVALAPRIAAVLLPERCKSVLLQSLPQPAAMAEA